MLLHLGTAERGSKVEPLEPTGPPVECDATVIPHPDTLDFSRQGGSLRIQKGAVPGITGIDLRAKNMDDVTIDHARLSRIRGIQ